MAEFGLCFGRLSHILKLHLHQCISEGHLQGPDPLPVVSARPLSSPTYAPKSHEQGPAFSGGMMGRVPMVP